MELQEESEREEEREVDGHEGHEVIVDCTALDCHCNPTRYSL